MGIRNCTEVPLFWGLKWRDFTLYGGLHQQFIKDRLLHQVFPPKIVVQGKTVRDVTVGYSNSTVWLLAKDSQKGSFCYLACLLCFCVSATQNTTCSL